MIRKRKQQSDRSHYCLLVNQTAANYDSELVRKLTSRIQEVGGAYTVFEPHSAMELMQQAQMAGQTKKMKQFVAEKLSSRGKVTALIACGGDGTFNLVARAAIEANLPVGVLPMGRHNNICRSVLGSDDPDIAIDAIVKRKYRKVDCASVAGQKFFGSIGFGFVPELERQLAENKRPRFGIGWSRLATKIVNEIKPKKLTISIDSFRFQAEPTMLNINLLPYSAGLEFTPASVCDDGQAEVVFDVSENTDHFRLWLKQVAARTQLYGSEIRMHRGRSITIQPVKETQLYLDGELIKLPVHGIEVKIEPQRLRFFC